MSRHISRRRFVQSSLLTSASLSLACRSQASTAGPQTATAAEALAKSAEPMPAGKIAGQQFSRLILGGNLIAGWSHSRDLTYVSTLMRRYNSPAKIRETLELAESRGITAI